jgi:hypothetical protein
MSKSKPETTKKATAATAPPARPTSAKRSKLEVELDEAELRKVSGGIPAVQRPQKLDQ